MPQRLVESGRIVPIRIYQTITTAGDTAEGAFDVGNSEINILEIVVQSWRQIFIEGRNDDGSNTTTQVIYGTRKWNDSVPATGNIFWDITENHWEVLDTQAAIASNTNALPKEFVDKGYTYFVVTQKGSGAGTSIINRAVLTG